MAKIVQLVLEELFVVSSAGVLVGDERQRRGQFRAKCAGYQVHIEHRVSQCLRRATGDSGNGLGDIGLCEVLALGIGDHPDGRIDAGEMPLPGIDERGEVIMEVEDQRFAQFLRARGCQA